MTGCSIDDMALVEQFGTYREKYFALTCGVFTRSAGEHLIELSYTWVKLAWQGAGLVERGRKRGLHRKRRPRRPLPGMLRQMMEYGDPSGIAGMMIDSEYARGRSTPQLVKKNRRSR